MAEFLGMEIKVVDWLKEGEALIVAQPPLEVLGNPDKLKHYCVKLAGIATPKGEVKDE